jgi:hypothetical protein
MHFSFRIDSPGLESTAFLIERAVLDASGDLETAFLENAGPLTRHRGKSIGELAVALAGDPSIEVLAISRNPALVLDAGLPARIAEAREMLAPLAGRWSLAAAGGMTPLGGRVCALYSSETPFIPAHRSPQPLTDPLPDLYLIDANWLRSVIARSHALPDSGFETVLVNQGYLDSRVALYAPALTAGIDGALRPRDPVKLGLDLRDWFADTLACEEIPTLMAPSPSNAPSLTANPPNRTTRARRNRAATLPRPSNRWSSNIARRCRSASSPAPVSPARICWSACSPRSRGPAATIPSSRWCCPRMPRSRRARRPCPNSGPSS